MNRRHLLLGGATGALALGLGRAATAQGPIRPWEYIEKKDQLASTDGTPLQFMPKSPPDPDPLTDELAKYPICPYCGMSRTKFSHSRHLIHYEDDLVDGTCSIHCAALSLALNMDRGPKAIYAGDAGSEAPVKPLVPVEAATYTIDSGTPGTMTRRSKFAYADAGRAAAAGGTTAGFETALTEAYADIARDTVMIREKRAERRRRAKRTSM